MLGGSMVQFEPIDIGHRDKIEKIRQKHNHILSSHAFSSLYLWRNKMKLGVFLTDRLFCIRREDLADHYFFPCGDEEDKHELISQLIAQKNITFQYIRNEDKIFLEQHFPGKFEFYPARDDWEYIYDRNEQVKMEGGGFKHLRAKVHKGENAHNWEVMRLSKDIMSSAAGIAHRWNDEVKHNGESADINATISAFENFEVLNLTGIMLVGDGIPLAFAMGSEITPDTFDLHISKTLESDIDYYLKWELYKQLPDKIVYINREEDLGLEGIRIHKTDMKPIRFNELWKGRLGADAIR
jgi:Uncharacterized conserved protein